MLRKLEDRAEERKVRLEELVDAVGQRAFPALLLVPSLVVVSPVSGIPGVSTVAGLTIFLIAFQYICNRKSVWLPEIILRQTVSSSHVQRTVDFLRRPSRWVEKLLKPRLTFLVERPFSLLVVAAIMLLGLTMPVMEFVPFTSSIVAGAIALLSLSLLFRDGLMSLLAAGTLLVAGYFIYTSVLS